MAEKLGINLATVNHLLTEIQEEEALQKKLMKESPIEYIASRVTFENAFDITDQMSKKETDEQLEVSAYWDHEPTPEEIIKKHKINTEKWKLSTFWSKGKAKGFLVSAQFSPLKKEENFTKKFEKFLTNYEPKIGHFFRTSIPFTPLPEKGILIVNKQDAHLNKLGISGKNDINARFSQIENTVIKLAAQASLSATIDKIIFIVGSDEFNSEWTGTTTKGTPQQNILSYEEAFEQICQHNLNLLRILYEYCSNVEVVFVKGNHDEYVGWHLVNWLKVMVEKTMPQIKFDTSTLNRKYIRYNKVGLMFNHGDAIPPKDLAQIFPMEFREEWSNCLKFNIFTGDKHHEKTLDVRGIKAYQLPALSSSKSKWDDKNGHAAIAEMEVFLINGENGNTYIYKEFL